MAIVVGSARRAALGIENKFVSRGDHRKVILLARCRSRPVRWPCPRAHFDMAIVVAGARRCGENAPRRALMFTSLRRLVYELRA